MQATIVVDLLDAIAVRRARDLLDRLADAAPASDDAPAKRERKKPEPTAPATAAPATAAPTTAAPATAAPTTVIDYPAVSAAITTLVGTKGRDVAVAVLAKFGVANAKALTPDQYAAVIAACETAAKE